MVFTSFIFPIAMRKENLINSSFFFFFLISRYIVWVEDSIEKNNNKVSKTFDIPSTKRDHFVTIVNETRVYKNVIKVIIE